MGMGTINLASTPCCGLIHRSYDCYPDGSSSTGFTHNPGGDYAPTPEDFRLEIFRLEIGFCPDCNKNFEKWLHTFGHFDRDAQRWEWDYTAAEKFFSDMPRERIDNMKTDKLSLPRILEIFRDFGALLRGKLKGQGPLRK